MFERFSREARGAVLATQEVARDVGSRSIDTRHVLVALGEGVGPAATALREAGVDVAQLTTAVRAELSAASLNEQALARLGIDLTEVRARTDAVFGPGALERAGRRPGRRPFTRDAKKALELALRETLRLQHKTIDGRHLLLGTLRADCPGRSALVTAGLDLSLLRQALDELEPPGYRSA